MSPRHGSHRGNLRGAFMEDEDVVVSCARGLDDGRLGGNHRRSVEGFDLHFVAYSEAGFRGGTNGHTIMGSPPRRTPSW